MKKIIIISIIVIAIVVLIFVFLNYKNTAQIVVTNFEECVATTGIVMESYPRQCRYNDETFTEFVGNEVEKMDLIRIDNPRPNQVITSPLMITGQARGYWFFEADFPVFVVDWDGRIIGEGYATAKKDWMVEDFVPFESIITFEVDPNVYSKKGSLILKKSNASGLPEHDDALEIPIIFE